MNSVSMTLATVALLVLGGCSGSSGESPETGSSAPAATSTSTPVAGTSSADPDKAACQLLSSKDREKLAGEPLETVAATDGIVADQQCRWSSETALLEVTSIPARTWAQSLPTVLANLQIDQDSIETVNKAQRATLERLLQESSSLSGDEACSVFGSIAELAGGSRDDDVLVSYTPIDEGFISISAQTCSNAIFTSLVFSKPTLTQSSTLEEAARVALRTARDNALAAR